jgi:hypothetical protein
MPPVLSICIPTRNRAETLRLTLENVLSETRPLGDRVEVVVADNASGDGTAEVLQAFAPWIRYQVRPVNLGYFGNVVGLATELARGRFVWALGDDDLILRGGLGRILAQLEDHPDTDLFYLNYGWIPVDERNRLIREGDSRMSPRAEDCNFMVEADVSLARLQDLALVPNRNSAGIFCAMFCYLLPRDFYVRFGQTLASRLWDCFSTDVDDIYPHAKVLMQAYRDRPARLLAEPALMQGTGLWEFGHWGVTYKIVPLLQLLDHFAALGLDGAPMARMREDFEATAGRNFARMILDPERNQGLDSVMAEAFPRLAPSATFWDRFFKLIQGASGPGAGVPVLGLLSPAQREALAPGVLERLLAREAQ